MTCCECYKEPIFILHDVDPVDSLRDDLPYCKECAQAVINRCTVPGWEKGRNASFVRGLKSALAQIDQS